MLTAEEADMIVEYINRLEEICGASYERIVSAFEADGYKEVEIDAALKALGKIAGRDCGLL